MYGVLRMKVCTVPVIHAPVQQFKLGELTKKNGKKLSVENGAAECWMF